MASTGGCLCFLLLMLASCSAVKEFPELDHIRSKVSAGDQTDAVKSLISRFIGLRSEDFTVKVDPSIGPKDRDTFQVTNGTRRGAIHVTGTSGVAVAMGVYYYLKTHVRVQMTWAGKQVNLPPFLPPVQGGTITITSNDRFRYYQNVCTVSYSMVFWQWERWEREIDWMALQGINFPLAFTGQEAIFQRVFMRLGFNQTDLDEHFGGPAFLAWARMGNIEGWGGPLPQMWITNKLVLQHKILERMRSLGMLPILPGFAGHMPRAVTRVLPKANVTKSSLWGQFNSTYSGVYLLDFHDPLFKKIGQMVITEFTNEFGTNHLYNTDTFNEMTPSSSDPAYLTSAGKAVFDALLAGDSQAIWVMQGWLFQKQTFWKEKQVKALVTSVPQGRMIILDLAAETTPIFQNFDSYYGQPFIWGMLHNFGGTNELYGAIESINVGPYQARSMVNSSIIGTGLTPEGINQNEVIYEFMNENAYVPGPRNITHWVWQFTQQRYGTFNQSIYEGWQLLMKSVYNCTDGHHDNDHVIITRRPHPQMSPVIWYDPEDLFVAWDRFLEGSSYVEGSELFQYDMADVTRNCLQVISMAYYHDIVEAYNRNDTLWLKTAGKHMSDLLSDMDRLLNSNSRFLLGKWIADAKTWATDAKERALLEFNARNQITLWGPTGNIVDYASKQWAGVFVDYYKPRWDFFTNYLVQLVQNGTKWSDFFFEWQILDTVEIPWTKKTNIYPTETTGNPILISRELYAKYRTVTRRPFFADLWNAELKRRQTLTFKPTHDESSDGLSENIKWKNYYRR